MKLEEQVVSLELAKEMKELGFGQESLWHWYFNKISRKNYITLTFSITKHHECISIAPAYTVAELGETLLTKIKHDGSIYWLNCGKDEESWWIEYVSYENLEPDYLLDEDEPIKADTEANARAKCLIYLVKNGAISVRNINKICMKE